MNTDLLAAITRAGRLLGLDTADVDGVTPDEIVARVVVALCDEVERRPELVTFDAHWTPASPGIGALTSTVGPVLAGLNVAIRHDGWLYTFKTVPDPRNRYLTMRKWPDDRPLRGVAFNHGEPQ